AAERWRSPRPHVGFCVVMDGTAATPDAYTGRAGIPAAAAVGRLRVLRIPCEAPEAEDRRFWMHGEVAFARYRDMSRGRYACAGGDPAERSEMRPTWLMLPDGSACGRLEDTR